MEYVSFYTHQRIVLLTTVVGTLVRLRWWWLRPSSLSLHFFFKNHYIQRSQLLYNVRAYYLVVMGACLSKRGLPVRKQGKLSQLPIMILWVIPGFR